MTQDPELRNDCERRMAAMHADRIDADTFMHESLESQLFVPVKDSGHGIANFRACQKAEPLALTAEDDTQVLILFSSPERARPFLDQLPGFEGGILEDLRWPLQCMAGGYGIAINPGSQLGLDLEPDVVTRRAHAAATRQSH